MDGRLQEAAATGDSRDLATYDPDMLLGTTPLGNTCLHIASVHGHEGFCEAALALKPSLLAAVNSDGETALLTAVTSGRVSLACVLLRCCRDQRLCETILKQDRQGCNALHHAVRGGHRKLALDLIEAEPALSKAVNQYAESPMFIAVLRNGAEVFVKLLGIPDSAHGGASGWNALHAAVRNGNSGETCMPSKHLAIHLVFFFWLVIFVCLTLILSNFNQIYRVIINILQYQLYFIDECIYCRI